MSKADILGRVRDSLKNNTHIPSPKVQYANPMNYTHKELLEEYKLNQSNNKAIVRESSLDTLESTIAEILGEVKAKEVLYNTDVSLDFKGMEAKFIPYTQSVDSMRGELFGIDTSIVEARCGVANLGIVGLSANPQAPRLSSLITNNCIYLLKKEHIVENLYAGIECIKTYEKNRSGSEILPTNIIFVAGPSRTADIELQTVFGVHGPRVVYVVLY
ncbi:MULTISPECIES: lactate utilization protein C [Helicobacter]|uniref:LutC/YkgG family protein n=2 Tax=Helicobacteraceae TaxID=72293 RepID=UPI000DCDFAE6|nr:MULTISPECIES: lactate utilization protein C [Helicobacter]MCI2235519.1 lactate utilization protein C [Helicobacter sp. CaF467b]MCI6312521.1 lactate utilization protein C [Helicobacter sp.]MCI7047844.1 lactate utilization protein C [Helicobacter sp.]MCI7710087.1 lactate utilization protein C [Helicobacter sp.]MCL9821531.1 lactate utilization protein C [Helicobacter colisuis]